MVLGKKMLQIEDGLFRFPGGGIDLYPITGGENHIFLQGSEGIWTWRAAFSILSFLERQEHSRIINGRVSMSLIR